MIQQINGHLQQLDGLLLTIDPTHPMFTRVVFNRSCLLVARMEMLEYLCEHQSTAYFEAYFEESFSLAESLMHHLQTQRP